MDIPGSLWKQLSLNPLEKIPKPLVNMSKPRILKVHPNVLENYLKIITLSYPTSQLTLSETSSANWRINKQRKKFKILCTKLIANNALENSLDKQNGN